MLTVRHFMEKAGNTEPATYFDTKEARLQERYEGLILGGAIGDALGMPVEGLTRQQIQQLYGPEGIQCYMPPPENSRFYHQLRPGQYTDDTQLMLATLQVVTGDYRLMGYKIFSPDIKGIVGNLAAELLKIKDSIRGAGRATWSAINKLKEAGPEGSGIEGALGTGAMTRIIPLAMLENRRMHPSYTFLIEDATKITHKGADAKKLVSMYKELLSELAESGSGYSSGKRDLGSLDEITEFLRRYTQSDITDNDGIKKLKNNLARLSCGVDLDEDKFVEQFGTSGVMWDVLPAALYSFLKSPKEFEESVLRAVNLGGDTDTAGFVTGQLSGAYNGIQNIPAHLISQLENKDELKRHGTKLFELTYANSKL